MTLVLTLLAVALLFALSAPAANALPATPSPAAVATATATATATPTPVAITPRELHATRWMMGAALAALAIVTIIGWWWAVTVADKASKAKGTRWLFVGADNRLSTSKTMSAFWVYAIVSALLGFVVAKLWGYHVGYDQWCRKA